MTIEEILKTIDLRRLNQEAGEDIFFDTKKVILWGKPLEEKSPESVTGVLPSPEMAPGITMVFGRHGKKMPLQLTIEFLPPKEEEESPL